MPDIVIEARVGIQAPAEIIWEVLGDVEGWPAWNPTYTKAKGTLGYGRPIELTLALPDQPPREIVATITEWVPDKQLLWTSVMMGGWVKTSRFIEIDSLTDKACIVANGEGLDGMLSGRAARKYGNAMYAGFDAMGLALKERAEALWRERGEGST
jgi:hypothetical protein